MTVVKVDVKLSRNRARTIYFDAVPTLEVLIDWLTTLGTPSDQDYLAVLKAAKPTMVSIEFDPRASARWCNPVRVAGVQLGVIEYDKIVVNQLEATEKVLPTSKRPQIAGTR